MHDQQNIKIRFHVYYLFKKTPQTFTFCRVKLRKKILQIIGFWQVSTNSHVFLIHVECRIKAVGWKYLLIYMLIFHSPLFVTSAQIQTVNSNSKFYVVYTLYIIRDAVICVCM